MKYVPIEYAAGVQPPEDNTEFLTRHWTASDKIRFVNGKPEKIGGWSEWMNAGDCPISGKIRSIFSTQFPTKTRLVLGTHQKLYDVSGNTFTNITPLQTTTTAIANSLATDYATLANNPITTVNGSNTLTIADTNAALYHVNMSITLSGSSTVNGVLNTTINATHVIRSIGVNSYTIRVATSATSSGSGGGASVVRATGRIRVTAASHGQLDCDRVKIAGAADTGGILAASINAEFIIENVASGTFDIFTSGTATSSVSGGGGASTTYQKEIADGKENEGYGRGYGMGLYGAGLYGVSKTSTTGRTYPRIWFFDRYGDNFIMTPGNQTGVYKWDGAVSVAPTLVTNAPTAVNYAFISDNILVTFGSGGVVNKIKTSDQGDITNWTSSALNQVFEDTVEGAGRLSSHVSLNGFNLIFTETQTYIFRKIPRDAGVWEIRKISDVVGVIAPMARVSVNGIAFWMGVDNFYMYRGGGNIEVMPSNSGPESTIKKYVFDNLNRSQKSKNFAWYNAKYNEIWFHYVSGGASEPDRIARVNLSDFSWCPDTMDRTAAEYPSINLTTPVLANSVNELFRHETGNNDNGAAMSFSLAGGRQAIDENVTLIGAVIPDSRQQGSITTTLKTYQYPQSTATVYDNDYTVTPTTEMMPVMAGGRYFKFEMSGSEIDQYWRMGDWVFEAQQGSRR